MAFSGSLRAASRNTRLLRRVAELAAPVQLEIVDYREVPLYDHDVFEHGLPAPVARLAEQVRAARGVLIATPEYNYGIPGPLKNALDWLSRPAYRSVFAGKPTAVLGVTSSPVGTARAQGQLKQVLLGMAAHVLPGPEVALGYGALDDKGFDAWLTSDEIATKLGRFVDRFAEFADRLSPRSEEGA